MDEMKIQWKQKISFGILMILSLWWPSFELFMGILILCSLYFLNLKNQKISKDFLTAVLPLFLIIFIGLVSAFFYGYNIADISKDIAYFSKPLMLLFLGYSLIKIIHDDSFLFKIFIYLSVFFAIIHLYNLITYPNVLHTSINTLRNDTGLSNDIELLALVFLLLGFKYRKLKVFKQNRTTNIIITLLTVSLFLYFSRTMWVAIFLLLLASFGYAKISLKALKYITLIFILIGGFYIYLFSIEIERGETGISTFLYKMKIAPEEIFMPKIDLNDHAALWDHWRAYEAKMAYDQMHGYQHLIGRGFGSLVDLHFVAPLNDDGMRYISSLHNGYVMIYYKTGIIGLLFYLIFILNLYLFTFYKKNVYSELPVNNLIAAIGVYLLFSTLIISGAYNLKDIYLFALGGMIALFDRFKLTQKTD